MKKNLIKTLLIGVTIGTALTGLASNRADACYLSHDTLAATTNRDRVKLCIPKGSGIYYKEYKSWNYDYTFYDYDPNFSEHPCLYCYDAYGKPFTGFLRNANDCYYFCNGKAITGRRTICGQVYDFDSENYKGHIVG